MTDIYAQHQTAFARTSAFVILDKGERVATVAIKFPADGAGRLYAYVHWLGTEMVRANANGYGYDKRSAAVSSALDMLRAAPASPATRGRFHDFHRSCAGSDAHDWTRNVESAGFTVLQAV